MTDNTEGKLEAHPPAEVNVKRIVHHTVIKQLTPPEPTSHKIVEIHVLLEKVLRRADDLQHITTRKSCESGGKRVDLVVRDSLNGFENKLQNLTRL